MDVSITIGNFHRCTGNPIPVERSGCLVVYPDRRNEGIIFLHGTRAEFRAFANLLLAAAPEADPNQPSSTGNSGVLA